MTQDEIAVMDGGKCILQLTIQEYQNVEEYIYEGLKNGDCLFKKCHIVC